MNIPLPLNQPPRRFFRPNVESETLNVLDAKNVEEKPAQTRPSPAADNKPDEGTTGPMFQLSQNGEAGGWGSTITKGGEASPEGPGVKPTLSLDHIREVSTASATTASDPGEPADDAPSFLPEEEGDVDAPRSPQLTRNQKKRLREKAKKQAQMGEKWKPRPASRAISNSVDDSVVQEDPSTAPVHIPVVTGDGVHDVDGRPDASVTAAETAITHVAGDDDDRPEWAWWQ